MKLDVDTIAYIQKVVKTAQMVGIDNVIIEPNTTRAIDDDKTVVLFQNENVPDMPFGSIGLNRIGVFMSRLDIAKTQDGFSIESDNPEGSEFVRSLTMKAKGVKIDYRCANPTTIQAPRQINDTLKYRVPLNAEAVVLLQKGQTAMSADIVTIVSNKSGVSFEIVDINKDVFSHTFTTKVENLTDNENISFAHRYPIKNLLPLFKQNADGYFEVGQKGILSISVQGLNLFVLPQV
jgi:hypothetical protein